MKKLNSVLIAVIFIFNNMYGMEYLSYKQTKEYYAITSLKITDIGKNYCKLPKSWGCRRDVLMQMPEKIRTLHYVHLSLPQKIQKHIFEYMAQSMYGDDTQNFYKEPLITIFESYYDLDKRIQKRHKSIIPELSSMSSDKRDIVLRALNETCPTFTEKEKKILDKVVDKKRVLKQYIIGKEASLRLENHIIFKKYVTFLLVMYGFHVTCKMMLLGLLGCVYGFDFMFTSVAGDVAFDLSYKCMCISIISLLIKDPEMIKLCKKFEEIKL